MAWHKNGIVWYAAPLPRRWHRCKAQTSGYVDGRLVERCACGAIRDGGSFWTFKNSRRREK